MHLVDVSGGDDSSCETRVMVVVLWCFRVCRSIGFVLRILYFSQIWFLCLKCMCTCTRNWYDYLACSVKNRENAYHT